MSNSSERSKPLGFDLRARIAAVLAEAQETHNGISDLALADAVIRELGLQLETGIEVRHCAVPYDFHRYVTEWENDE